MGRHRQVEGPDPARTFRSRPFFHNRSAQTLEDVVTFYHSRLNIGFTQQEKEDLIAFQRTL